MQIWQAGRFQIPLQRPQIMGIVNVTPDSFSDGGQYSQSVAKTLLHAEELLADGADILDIGGESTRPNAVAVSIDEEWRRVQPVLAEVAKWKVPISLDTRRSEIMRRALEQGGVDIINDVQALEDEGAVEALAQSADTGICLMHMQGLPENMQNNPDYGDVCVEVATYLNERVAVCKAAGIARKRLMLDLGFGFGKTLQHNVILMRNLPKLLADCGDLPMLVGVSRKRMIGELTGQNNAADRVSGSVAAALFAATQGAKILRVHDVRETADALKVWQALAM